ncbi:MAG: ABC transporter ATP-binding protein, partial [Actinomycetia bacterium]|nr:ABC transporter ATP-binding protein [Actinomycetes bacterium]
RPGELARLAGVVPQQFNLDFAFTVEEMVAMGRYARDAPAADGEAVAAALEATRMTAFADRLITELSGGERQRALIAQTLAQQTPILLLDEPLNNLDLNHQLKLMQLLSRLHGEGRTILLVLHDLNMAAQYCDELVLLSQGQLAARGTPNDILDPRTILEVFKVRVAVHRQGSRPYLTPVWSTALEGLPAGGRRVHVIAGGGAASGLLEELVRQGFTPTVGIVSVFDSDYTVAQEYELEVVSAPPFEPFPPEALQEFDSLAHEAEVLIVAPVFFGRGNLAPLRTALQVCRAGKRVIVIDGPPIEERDLSGGEATGLVTELLAAGALRVGDINQAVKAAAEP